MNATPMKQPSAILPVAMSIVALALVLGHVAVYGIVHEADEGTPAHLFQLLMAAQVPIVAFFLLLQKQFVAASLAGALKQ